MRLVDPTLATRKRHVLKSLEYCEADPSAGPSGHHPSKGTHVILDTDHRTEPVLGAEADVSANKRASRTADRYAKRRISLQIVVEEIEL